MIQDAEYSSVLKIAERGDAWDLKELYDNGALAGRYRGNQVFAAWLSGPPTSSYLNRNGLPVWNYKYKITYPGGATFEGSPGGFYTPGYTVVTLGVGAETHGKWKIEWYIINRDTNEVHAVATSEFTTTW
ncbi:MAG: hypothetical protein JW904_00775 [Spirochaetales bacterium]|nr:hypothetical protein [Spirochaetales bacterium]